MKLIRFTALAILAVALIGLSFNANMARAQSAGGNTFIVAIHNDLLNANNYVASLSGAANTVWNDYVWGLTHSGLYGLSTVDLSPIPGVTSELCSNFSDQNKEGNLFVTTCKLLSGVKWTDGTEMTADDVAFTYNTMVTVLNSGPAKGSTLQTALGGGIVGLYDDTFIDHVAVVDAHTVKFLLKQIPGIGAWEYTIAGAPILQKAFWQDKFENALASDDPVKTLTALTTAGPKADKQEPTSGPFSFKQWQQGAFAETAANANFSFKGEVVTEYKDPSSGATGWSDVLPAALGGGTRSVGNTSAPVQIKYTEGPNVDGTLFNLYGSQALSATALIKGDVDYVFNPLGYGKATLDQLNSTKGVSVLQNSADGVFYLSFNMRKAPFNDLGFRQAVRCVINKEHVANDLLGGLVIPAYSPVPIGNGFWHYEPTVAQKAEGCVGFNEAQRIAVAAAYLGHAGFGFQQAPQVTGDVIDKGAGGSDDVPAGAFTVYRNIDTVPIDITVNPADALICAEGLGCTSNGPGKGTVAPGGVAIVIGPAHLDPSGKALKVSAKDTLKSTGSGLKDSNGNLVPQLNLLHPNAAYDNNRNIFGLNIVDELNKLGVPISDVPAGFNNIVTLVFGEQNFDMWQLGWSLTPFPHYLFDFFNSSQTAPNDNGAQGGVCSADDNKATGCQDTYDKLSNALLAERDIAKAQQIALQLQSLIYDNVAYVPTHYTIQYDAYRVDRINWQGIEKQPLLDGTQGSGRRGLADFVQLSPASQ